MGKYKLNIKADREKLNKAFEKYLPKVADDIEFGENYGYISGNEIHIFTKKPMRSFKTLAHDKLIAKIDDGGNIEYDFVRDFESAILTMCMPAALLVLGCGLGAWLLKIPSLSFSAIPALLLYLCNFIKPKKQREDLLDCLLRMVELSER